MMIPLPVVPYETGEWVGSRKVANDCHVAYKRNRYSVPHRLVGRVVELRETGDALEIWNGDERVAVHRLFDAGQSNRPSTRDADLPEKTRWREWDERRVKSWAIDVGPNTVIVVARIFQDSHTPNQAINPALAVSRLSRRYGRQRLENACDVARRVMNAPPVPAAEGDSRHRTGPRGHGRRDPGDQGHRHRPGHGLRAWRRLLREGGGTMRLDELTRRQLRDMGCQELLDPLLRQGDDACASLSMEQRICLAVDEAHAMFTDKRVGGLARRARLRYPQADLRTLDMLDERGISRELIASLADCAWVARHRNIVAQGYCGSGKSWIICALAC